MAKRARLDLLLVERGLFETRTKAQAAIMAGLILIDGMPSSKAGELVPFDCELALKSDPCPFVSRGGLKLRAALDAFKRTTSPGSKKSRSAAAAGSTAENSFTASNPADRADAPSTEAMFPTANK